MELLVFLAVILSFIVIIGIFNDRIIHMQSDIALITFSLIVGIVMLLLNRYSNNLLVTTVIDELGDFGFESYLFDGVLCFMLFAGASKVSFHKFKQNIRAISLLALLTTVISSGVYGLLFWIAAASFHLPVDLWTCILIGCVVSPTDPIAATGILNKLGLSKNVISVIECESLFNDGTGVALFVFVKSIVSKGTQENFLLLMGKELLGAIAGIIAVILSRYTGVMISSLLTGRKNIPSSYSLN